MASIDPVVQEAILASSSPFLSYGVWASQTQVKALQLFNADPTKVYWVKYFFYLDIGTRFGFDVWQSNYDGSGSLDACSFDIGSGASFAGLQSFTLAAVGGSGITGNVVIDFGAGAAITTDNPGSYPSTGLRPSAIFTSTAYSAWLKIVIDAEIVANASSTANIKLPFADAVNTPFIQSLVQECWVYDADPTHQYIISNVYLDVFSGIPQTRFIITIHDLTTAADVCQYELTVASALSLAGMLALIPTTIKLTDATVSPATNVYAVMTLNLAAFTAFGDQLYTTYAQSGLNTLRTLSDEQVADYLDRDLVQQYITVGAAGEYATIGAALTAIQIGGGNLGCNFSHYNNRIALLLTDDANYPVDNVTVPEYCEIWGNGVGRTIITNSNPLPTSALLQMHLDCKMRDLTIFNNGGDGVSNFGQYAIHSDNSNIVSRPSGVNQNRRLRQSFKRVQIINGPNNNVEVFGGGLSSGETILFEDCNFSHQFFPIGSDSAAFGEHNTGPYPGQGAIPVSAKPGVVIMRSSGSDDISGETVLLNSVSPGAINRLVMESSTVQLIQNTLAVPGYIVTNLAAQRWQWEIGGVYDGPIVQVDPEGAWVLATTPGIAVSGTAAAVIFGAVDNLGQGSLWVYNSNTTYNLGHRLGNCSITPLTLTIAGQSHTFNTDQTSLSNTAIISAINADITSNPVSQVDIQTQLFPDVGYTRTVLNSTGSTIPAGTILSAGAGGTVVLANGSSPFFCWCCRAIPNGQTGQVQLTKKVHTSYLSGASSNGEFGITAGYVDYGNMVRKGVIIDSIATFY